MVDAELKTYYIGFLCRVLSKNHYHSCLPFSSVLVEVVVLCHICI